MPFDAFLKIDGIEGECTDDKHKGWIEALSYNVGVSQPLSGASASAGAHAGGRADFQDFSFTKRLDKSSPKLFEACASGKNIKEIILELCRATGDKKKYMEYKFGNCIISSIGPGGPSDGAEPVPLEDVTVNYTKVEVEYEEYDHETDKSKGKVKAGWDLAKDKKV